MTTATGNVAFWKHYFGLNLSGVGDYTLEDGSLVSVSAGGYVPPPKEKTEKPLTDTKQPHPSLNLAYGKMFYGVFK